MMRRRSATYGLLKTLAVPGVTAFFLVACGGGGGKEPAPADPEPGGGMKITPLREYGSIAYGIMKILDGSRRGQQISVTGSRTSTSRSAARDSAVASCRGLCDDDDSCTVSSCREVLRFRNACGSLAVGAPVDVEVTGVGWGASESVAERNAIAACSAEGGKDCALKKNQDSDGNRSTYTFCARAGSADPSGQANAIPPLPLYPSSEPTERGCYNPASSSVHTCVQLANADCSDIPGGRQVQQCPTSSDAHRTIHECSRTGFRRFTYMTESLDEAMIRTARSNCEQAEGSSFTLHKSAAAPTPVVEYGSIAYGIKQDGTGLDSVQPLAGSGKGTSQSQARDRAVASCQARCAAGNCSCREVLSFRNACGAYATTSTGAIVGDPGTGFRVVYFSGVGWDASESVARRKAIAACNEAKAGEEAECKVHDNYEPSFCTKAGSAAPSGQASKIPPLSTGALMLEPEPEPTPTPSLSWNVVDACNDRRRVEYRFFEFANGRRTGRLWPSDTGFYYTSEYNRTHTNRLMCRPGTSIAIGARIQGRSGYFGVGFDGSEGCDDCSYACGTTDISPFRFGCPSN